MFVMEANEIILPVVIIKDRTVMVTGLNQQNNFKKNIIYAENDTKFIKKEFEK